MDVKKPKIKAALERGEQKALIQWLNYHPVLRDYFFKIDNEGKRTLQAGHQAKLMGLRPGVSDIFIYYPVHGYQGFFLEVKRNKSYTKSERSTPTWIAQEAFLDIVKGVGYQGQMCYGWEHGKRLIEEYLLLY